jgi:hypothetical protein
MSYTTFKHNSRQPEAVLEKAAFYPFCFHVKGDCESSKFITTGVKTEITPSLLSLSGGLV